MTVTNAVDEGKGLKKGAVGLASSIVIGVSSTAPGYSIAATLGFVVAAVGLQSPAIFLVAFIPMFCIAYAYRELNKLDPDCGTTFTWAARAFGPRTGWMGGWAIVVADVVVMANLAQIAGQYGFLLVEADGLAESTFWTTFVGCLWIISLTYMCYRGLEISAKFQIALLAFEIVVIAIYSFVALIKVYAGKASDAAVDPQLSWINPFAIDSFSAVSAGVLLAVFIYWGWDTTVAINEETKDPATTPGKAAVISTVLLLGIYVLISVASQAYAGPDALVENADDVLFVVGNEVLGSTFGKLLVLTVLTSAAACTQTTILPTARTTLSMASHRAIHNSFARIHPTFLTPTTSTIAMGIASVVFYVGLVLVSGNVLADSILALGLFIAFYYGLTGAACVWQFRRDLTKSVNDFVVKGLLPAIGTTILAACFIKSAKDMFAEDYGDTSFHGVGGVFILGVGGLVVGVGLMAICEIVAPTYFRGPERGPLPKVVVDPITLPEGVDQSTVTLASEHAGEPLVLPGTQDSIELDDKKEHLT